jgi:methylmalonyl-CoA mutase C-terminal domain/subunit
MRQRAAPTTANRPDHRRDGGDGAKRKKGPTATPIMVDKERGSRRKIRILVAKPGLDGHDRGVLVLARSFRDAGMEVIYIGLLPTPEEVARMAVDEDVDVVALSLLNGAHMTAFPQVKRLLDKFGGKDIIVIGGGIIPDEDKPRLLKLGISGLYGPGTSLEEIISHIEGRVRNERRGAAEEEGAAATEEKEDD